MDVIFRIGHAEFRLYPTVYDTKLPFQQIDGVIVPLDLTIENRRRLVQSTLESIFFDELIQKYTQAATKLTSEQKKRRQLIDLLLEPKTCGPMIKLEQ